MRSRQPAIVAKDVSKVYGSSATSVAAVNQVSFHVLPGEIVALLGPSGCGKSTLLAMLAGLARPSAGEILIDGEPPSVGRDIGLMFQKSLLFPWRTVLDNILLPAQILKLPKEDAVPRAKDLLQLVGLGDWLERYPNELSGGMQQRVALARVLLADPSLLLLMSPLLL